MGDKICSQFKGGGKREINGKGGSGVCMDIYERGSIGQRTQRGNIGKSILIRRAHNKNPT